MVSPPTVENKLLSNIIKRMCPYRANVWQVCWWPTVKLLGSPRSAFLRWATSCWATLHRPQALGATSAFAACPAVSNKSFVSDLKVTCLLPTSVKLGLANISALKQRKFQTLHTSRQIFRRKICIRMERHRICTPVFQVA